MAKGGGSESSSSSSTSTTTQDNKVSATDNAIALGNESQFTYTDQFSDNVKSAYLELLNLAREVGQTAIGFAQEAVKANENAVKTVTDNSQKTQELLALKDQSILKDSIPYIGIAAMVFFIFSGGKK